MFSLNFEEEKIELNTKTCLERFDKKSTTSKVCWFDVKPSQSD